MSYGGPGSVPMPWNTSANSFSRYSLVVGSLCSLSFNMILDVPCFMVGKWFSLLVSFVTVLCWALLSVTCCFSVRTCTCALGGSMLGYAMYPMSFAVSLPSSRGPSVSTTWHNTLYVVLPLCRYILHDPLMLTLVPPNALIDTVGGRSLLSSHSV